jgi:hypothetical protein
VPPLDPAPRVAPLFQSSFLERFGQLSPDGQWIAYVSDASGQGGDVFIARFPTGAHRTPISRDARQPPGGTLAVDLKRRVRRATEDLAFLFAEERIKKETRGLLIRAQRD